MVPPFFPAAPYAPAGSWVIVSGWTGRLSLASSLASAAGSEGVFSRLSQERFQPGRSLSPRRAGPTCPRHCPYAVLRGHYRTRASLTSKERLGRPFEWVAPVEAWKPTVIPVRSNPLASRFDGQRGEIRVCNQVPPGVRCLAKVREYPPVPASRRNEDAVWPIAQGARKRKGTGQRSGHLEYAGVCDHPEEPAQNEVRHPEGSFRVRSLLKPLVVGIMIRRILPVRVDKYVDVEENQRDSSMRSRRAAVSSRSTPG